MGKYRILWNDVKNFPLEEPDLHQTFRAIRAVCRLSEEKVVSLSEANENAAYALFQRLEDFVDRNRADQPLSPLLLTATRTFLVNFRERFGEFFVTPPEFRHEGIPP